ncbi:MAG: 50S ribosome-binding GTPase [Desulfovibrio sp.]|nr:50S ribosome-binding GTPase [Desulfovibrio sp.]
MPDMQTSVNNFSNRLISAQKALENAQQKTLEAGTDIFATIEKCAEMLLPPGDNKSTYKLQEEVEAIFKKFQIAVKERRKQIEANLDLRRKIEEYGEGLIVVVFGRTNAGKSTLGNFMRGKSLKHAAFPNAWRDDDKFVGPIKVIAQDSTSETASEISEFKEGSTETTKEIQLFKLPGFLWIDTPGFGSTNDNTLGKMARDYTKTAHLIIYLEHTDNPGQKSITENIVPFLQEGKRNTLVAINHSDTMTVVKGSDGKSLKGPDGKILRSRVAKDPKRRSEQEKYMEDELTRILGDKSIGAISISMFLANEAIKNNDEDLYRDSNIDSLFQKIEDLIPDNQTALKLKFGKTLQDCVVCINETLDEKEADNGEALDAACEHKILTLSAMEKSVNALREKVRQCEQDFNVDVETRRIVDPIMNIVRVELGNALENAQTKLEAMEKSSGANSIIDHIKICFGATGNNFPKRRQNPNDRNDASAYLQSIIEEMQKRIEHATFATVNETIKKLLNDIWTSEAENLARDFPEIEKAQLKRRTETFTYEVTEIYTSRRSPSGVIEHVKSWFGATYSSTHTRKVQKEQTIDLGYNTDEERARVIRNLENSLRDYVRDQLTFAKNECVVKGLELLGNASASLKTARESLVAQRDNLLKELDALGN